MGKLEFKHFSLNIGETILLNNISFSLEQGKTLAVIGESGSGKTLLSKAIIGNFPQKAEKSGEIFFNGQNLLNFDARQWQELRGKTVSYIAQNPMAVFNPMQTIASHGRELFKSILSLNKKDADRRLIHALSQFNLTDGEKLIYKYPFQLSGGMLQRIMLAMMMELSPQLVIADEPTSALDKLNKDNVTEALNTCKEKGVSLILVTHDYRLMKELAEEIVVFKRAELIEWGKANELIDHPKSQYTKELVQDSFVNIKNPIYGS